MCGGISLYFYLHFLITNNIIFLFMCIFPLYVFFGEMSIQVFWHCLNQIVVLLLSCRNSSYILDNILYQTYVFHIFSPSLCLVFRFLTLTFEEQKLSVLRGPIQQFSFYLSFSFLGSEYLKPVSYNHLLGHFKLPSPIVGTWAFITFALVTISPSFHG